MPWHDVQIKIEGETVKDLCYHFTLFWNFAKTDIDPKRYEEFLHIK